MPFDRVHLREQLVYLECVDAHHMEPDPGGYQQAARALRHAVVHQLAAVPMQEFAHSDLQALQTIAQNVFFESRGRFADLDGSGTARRAFDVATALLSRVRQPR